MVQTQLNPEELRLSLRLGSSDIQALVPEEALQAPNGEAGRTEKLEAVDEVVDRLHPQERLRHLDSEAGL